VSENSSFDIENDMKDPVSSVSNTFDIDIDEIIAYSERNGILNDGILNDGFMNGGSVVAADSADACSGVAAAQEQIEAAIHMKVNTVRTSSMGRLFDAVSSLLGICHYNRYEGESAALLENAAYRALMRQHATCDTTDFLTVSNEADELALKFHLAVASAILKQCNRARAQAQTNTVALSGGVFQNKILMEETLRLLRADAFEVYYNVHVPPGDGGIALGQNFIGMQLLQNRDLPY
jgi:hydrogenase maturation factor HypF (carbamoyltransferase family)